MAKKPGLALVGAAARVPAKAVAERPIATAVAQSIEAFEQAIGGRRALIEALSAGDSADEVQQVLTLIADPKCDRWSLARICARGGISPGQLFQALRQAAVARAQVLAMVKVANRLPEITEQLLDDAVRHTVPCEACNGVGQKVNEPTKKIPNPEPYTCGTCQGKGEITVPASLEQQKIALELAQLLKKSGGIAIGINNTQITPSSGSTGGSLEQLQQAVGEILYGGGSTPPADAPPPEAVEGDLVEDPAAEA